MATISTAGGHVARRGRFVQEHRHDSDKLPGKLAEPTVCPSCSAVYHKGRWSWSVPPAGAQETICPAYHRMKNKHPKGFLTLKGAVAPHQSEQMMGVIKNIAAKENKEHPLARIMSIDKTPDGLIVLTTDSHLPKQIGGALKQAYHGELVIHYNQGEDVARVTWTHA